MNRGKQAYVVILYLFVYIESIYNASVIKKEHYFFCNFKKIHYYNLKLTNNTKTVLKSLLQPQQPSAYPVCNHHKDKQQRQLPKKREPTWHRNEREQSIEESFLNSSADPQLVRSISKQFRINCGHQHHIVNFIP